MTMGIFCGSYLPVVADVEEFSWMNVRWNVWDALAQCATCPTGLLVAVLGDKGKLFTWVSVMLELPPSKLATTVVATSSLSAVSCVLTSLSSSSESILR